MFKGFWKESVSYIAPKGILGWAKFLVRYPLSFCKFKWLAFKDSRQRPTTASTGQPDKPSAS